MSDKIIVPTLGESVTEATVSKWLKNQGEKVSADEPIVELETDKVNVEVPAPSNGVLGSIEVKEGETVNVGSLLGIIAAINRNTVFDYSVMGVSLVGICVPSFVMAPLLSLFFSLYLGILPTSGWNNGNILNLILPITALSLPQIAVISRMMRASTIEVLNSNFIRTAKSKGLNQSYIIRKNVIRASILPIIEYLAPASAGLMTGSIIIEQIFGLPGIGRYFVVGALQRDYTLVSGVLILYASLLIFLILITDIIRAILDPRVKI